MIDPTTREALIRESAAIGWDAAVAAMTYEDGSPVEIVAMVNPYRAAFPASTEERTDG